MNGHMQRCLVQWVRSAKTPSGFPADRHGARGCGVAWRGTAWRARLGVGVMRVRRYVPARAGRDGKKRDCPDPLELVHHIVSVDPRQKPVPSCCVARAREKERSICMYVCIYIYVYGLDLYGQQTTLSISWVSCVQLREAPFAASSHAPVYVMASPLERTRAWRVAFDTSRAKLLDVVCARKASLSRGRITESRRTTSDHVRS